MSQNKVETDVCLPAIIYAFNPDESNPPHLPVDFMPDTGSIQDNFINEEMAAWLEGQGVQPNECLGLVCSGLDRNMCMQCGTRYTF